MREKIGKLAKGLDTGAPVIKVMPESVFYALKPGVKDSFYIEISSVNGQAIKGLVLSDELRVRPDEITFAGRRIHIQLHISTVGLKPGSHISCDVRLITNGGELSIPCRFDIKCLDENEPINPADIRENTLSYADNSLKAYKYVHVENGGDYDTGDASAVAGRSYGTGENATGVSGDYDTGDAAAVAGRAYDTGDAVSKVGKVYDTEDGDAFNELLSDLISNKDVSPYAFQIYKKAIERHINYTRLYESYVAAYPEDCTEEMPREVILYFSYDIEAAPDICEKIYANILTYQSPDSEIYEIFAPRMSAFAMNRAISGRINKRLALIYDRMIYSDMVDRKAAEILPDIFKCREIRLTEGEADFLTVSSPELKSVIKADISDGMAYVPVYFEDSKIDFYRYDAVCVSGEVRYESKAIFKRQDILNRCFELYPDHPMLRASACRQIVYKGACGLNDNDREVLFSALDDDNISDELRAGIIRTLCEAGGDLSWMQFISEDDIDPDTCPYIFDVFMAEGQNLNAWSLIKKYGIEMARMDELSDLCEKMISEYGDRAGEDEDLILLCKYLFDREKIPDEALELLCACYMGSISDMLKIFSEAGMRGTRMGRIPERLITFELFADVSDQIDEVFDAYVRCCDYEDIVVRAYFQTRCSEHFLYEGEVNREILMGYLYSYIRAQTDPLELPVIFLIAMTSDFSDREKLDEDEAALCTLIINELIERGFIFRYTKKLRKLIHIPEEICWKYYIEYRAEKGSEEAPKLLVKILPDEGEYHTEEMRRVYKNVYVMSTVLFIGDRLHYLIYPSHSAPQASEEGEISVVKLHRQGDDRMRYINLMMKAIEEKDEELLKDSMLNYAESVETVRLLFDPGIK